MIRVTLLREGSLQQGDEALIDLWSAANGDKLWVDIESDEKELVEPLLEERFGFHELAAEDSLSSATLPKYDAFPEYDFFVFRAINMNVIEHDVDTLKMATFLSESFLFTIHAQRLVSVDSVWERLPQDKRLCGEGMDFLLHAILDVQVDLYFPLLDEIEELVDQIQRLIFTRPAPSLLDELLNLKRDLNTLRRHAMPQRELFNMISRGTSTFISKDHLIYFRDLFDHMFRITESVDVERDLVSGTMEAYLSVVANRTNDIMKVLTVFSAIMLPLNFVAGFYGMNFERMPLVHWRYGWEFSILLMLAFGMLMLTYFVRKGWIGSRKEIRGLRRTAYKKLTLPLRYARHAAKKAVKNASTQVP
ncbi:MAG: magnesium/cobalt transporter CorA [Acidobacteriota bacterium]